MPYNIDNIARDLGVDKCVPTAQHIAGLARERDDLRRQLASMRDVMQTKIATIDRLSKDSQKLHAVEQRIGGLIASEAAVTAERNELQATFDLTWKASMRAIERWQQATGKTMTWPDHADLCVWLMEQLDTVTAERDDLRRQLADVLIKNGELAVALVDATAERDDAVLLLEAIGCRALAVSFGGYPASDNRRMCVGFPGEADDRHISICMNEYNAVEILDALGRDQVRAAVDAAKGGG